MVEQGKLKVIEAGPLNAATPLAALHQQLTPTELFYVRNHFAIPELAVSQWKLTVAGHVQLPVELSLSDLQSMDVRTCRMLMECAGNARFELSPPAPGTQWNHGAVSQGDFTGVPLTRVLDLVKPRQGAVEILFHGADSGQLKTGRQVGFSRSLPLSEALKPDTILAWSMNGSPLTANHGFPLRLVVPGWYGMASVKWLTRIEVLTNPFTGYFQRERYVYQSDQEHDAVEPVTRVKVRSLITNPMEGEALNRAHALVQGLAWSGYAPIERVELSWDGGESWHLVEYVPSPARYAAGTWHYRLPALQPDQLQLMARATDQAGHKQPLSQSWNTYGYGNNGVHAITVQMNDR